MRYILKKLLSYFGYRVISKQLFDDYVYTNNRKFSLKMIPNKISEAGWIFKKIPFSNTSTGYHSFLINTFETYIKSTENKKISVLLISESLKVKEEFEQKYPTCSFKNTRFL